MYGIVNKAIEDLVRTIYGEERWELIKVKSGVNVDFFISNQPYDDDITYRIVEAISTEMGIPVEKVLDDFGEWWVVKTGQEKYGSLMKAGGSSLREFLINLPEFHNRIMLIYTKLTPPEFRISNLEQNSLHVHYYSSRPGLQAFLKGMLKGLGKIYHTNISVELLESRNDGKDHDIFKVQWQDKIH